jgi:hypothetical protein
MNTIAQNVSDVQVAGTISRLVNSQSKFHSGIKEGDLLWEGKCG